MPQLIHQKEKKNDVSIKDASNSDVQVPKFSKSNLFFNQSNLINVTADPCRHIVLLSL
jgi:hypothetical protein